MANSGAEDEEWGSDDEEEREQGDDDSVEEEPSGSSDSVKPILCLPERNEEDTSWTHSDGTKPASAKNKLKTEDMGTVRKRKDLMWTEAAKNDQDSLVDRWLRDQIKPDTWDKIAHVFPQGVKCSPQQKWVHMLQVRLFLPLDVDQQLVGVGKDDVFGQRLTIICILATCGAHLRGATCTLSLTV